MDGAALTRYLKARHTPIEDREMFKQKREVTKKVQEEMGIPDLGTLEPDNRERVKTQIKNKVKSILKKKIYSWTPVSYDKYKALTYLIGRSAQEYSAINRIFLELSKRDPEFKPRSFFDFGSGVGTGTWAVSNLWKDSIYEYFLVDTSKDMNDISDLILREGDANKHHSLKNVYHRQFLPASNQVYSI